MRELLTRKQKADYLKQIKLALRCLEQEVKKSPLLEEVTLDSKNKISSGWGWGDSTYTEIVLTKKGKLRKDISEGRWGTDGSESERKYSENISVQDCIDLGITPEKIEQWRRRLT